jgi:hypothetical protein
VFVVVRRPSPSVPLTLRVVRSGGNLSAKNQNNLELSLTLPVSALHDLQNLSEAHSWLV